jgi:exodeoxyribonuclease-5
MVLPSAFLVQKFQHTPTPDQNQLFKKLDEFLLEPVERSTFLLRGYAGTGKTSSISALVQTLPRFDYKYLLMAPTGRAAKVMSGYAQRQAFTIHKIIYKHSRSEEGPDIDQRLRKNYSQNTVFIVDEASMLSDTASGGGYGLLQDLVNYVFQHESNKLLLVGDTAQLPPVHQPGSPALNKGYLQQQLRLSVEEVELTTVVRQEKTSGILFNATNLRHALIQEPLKIELHSTSFEDTYRMSGEKLEDGLRYAYNKYGESDTLIICRSNKAAVMYNQYIRRSIFFTESELDAGDLIMIAKNNYTWLPNDSPAGFLANGDFARIQKIVTEEEMHGFRFATVMLELPDYPETPAFEAKLILESLHAQHPALPAEDFQLLYESVKNDYPELSGKALKESLRQDLYLNALQVKFAYALTCHKAQGGQWSAVFVEQGFLQEDKINREWCRWLYTAITRATTELYFVNFNVNFFI